MKILYKNIDLTEKQSLGIWGAASRHIKNNESKIKFINIYVPDLNSRNIQEANRIKAEQT